MDAGLYSASAGLFANLHAQDVTAHNLANINTAGYKRRVAVYEPFAAHLAEATAEAAGVTVDGVAIDYTPGHRLYSGEPLHLMIEGEGFFVLRGASGEVYTRNGCFQLDAQRQIVDAAGRPLLGGGGELRIPKAGGRVRVDPDGQVRVGGTSVGRIRVVDVPKPRAFVAASNGAFTLPAGVPPPRPVPDARVEQGYLEGANTNAIDELVATITTLRSFEGSQRTVRSIDESYAQLNEAARKSS